MNQMWNNTNISENNTFCLLDHDKASENTFVLIGCAVKISMWCSDWNCRLKFFWMSLQATCHRSERQPNAAYPFNRDCAFLTTWARFPVGKKRWHPSLDKRGSNPQFFSAPQPPLLGMPTEPDPQVAEQVYIGDSIQCFSLWCLALFVMLQGVPTEWMAATLECRAARCGGSCTAPASPSGMSETHQGVLKGTKACFWAAEGMP